MALDRVLTPIKCSSEQLERWKLAAVGDERSLSGWVRVVLDAAAGSVGAGVAGSEGVAVRPQASAVSNPPRSPEPPVDPLERPLPAAPSDPLVEARRRLALLARGRDVSPVSREWSARRGKS